MPRPKIRVKHCRIRDWPAGWFVQFRTAGGWEAVRELRFVRQRDAELALAALLLAGITTKRKLLDDVQRAIEVAFGALQW